MIVAVLHHMIETGSDIYLYQSINQNKSEHRVQYSAYRDEICWQSENYPMLMLYVWLTDQIAEMKTRVIIIVIVENSKKNLVAKIILNHCDGWNWSEHTDDERIMQGRCNELLIYTHA